MIYRRQGLRRPPSPPQFFFFLTTRSLPLALLANRPQNRSPLPDSVSVLFCVSASIVLLIFQTQTHCTKDDRDNDSRIPHATSKASRSTFSPPQKSRNCYRHAPHNNRSRPPHCFSQARSGTCSPPRQRAPACRSTCTGGACGLSGARV